MLWVREGRKKKIARTVSENCWCCRSEVSGATTGAGPEYRSWERPWKSWKRLMTRTMKTQRILGDRHDAKFAAPGRRENLPGEEPRLLRYSYYTTTTRTFRLVYPHAAKNLQLLFQITMTEIQHQLKNRILIFLPRPFPQIACEIRRRFCWRCNNVRPDRRPMVHLLCPRRVRPYSSSRDYKQSCLLVVKGPAPPPDKRGTTSRMRFFLPPLLALAPRARPCSPPAIDSLLYGCRCDKRADSPRWTTKPHGRRRRLVVELSSLPSVKTQLSAVNTKKHDEGDQRRKIQSSEDDVPFSFKNSSKNVRVP